MKNPNILFIFSDQQRWDTIGVYGHQPSITPNLDHLAGEGVRFEHAFTPQPLCGPARACLQTGRYPTEIGCHVNNRMLPVEEQTIAKILASHGYETAYIGKWHLASGPDNYRTSPVPVERRGGYADYWLASDVLEFTSHAYDGHVFDMNGMQRDFPPGKYRVDVLTDWVIEYLRGRKSQRPFFLFVSFIEPHHQNDHHHFEGPEGSKEKFKTFTIPGDLVDTRGDWRIEFPDYLGCINSIDQNIGRIRTALDELGLSDNTLIIYTSDHGCHFRTRNLEYKRSCHDASIRVPLIIRGPGFEGGKTVDELVSLIDLPATILSTAGVSEIPATIRGRKLQDLVAGKPRDWRDSVFVQISESQCSRAVRTREWKYSVKAPGLKFSAPDSSVYEEDCLYDLQRDPFERRNLVTSKDHGSKRQQLKDLLIQCMTQAGEKPPEIIPRHGRAWHWFH
nr:sulfatase-like hydrolase/transferase [Candidatus Sigynarchaeota archaeon]